MLASRGGLAAARSSVADAAVQHGRSRPRDRRSARRRCRPRRTAARAAARQGRQVAGLPHLAGDGRIAQAIGYGSAWRRKGGALRLESTPAAHALWHLQACQATYARPRSKRRRVDGCKTISPHWFRHTTAVRLLEAGVEANVIRGWLGHVSLETTNRYAEITMRTKQAALAACMPPTSSAVSPTRVGWRQDQDLMKWLQSL